LFSNASPLVSEHWMAPGVPHEKPAEAPWGSLASADLIIAGAASKLAAALLISFRRGKIMG